MEKQQIRNRGMVVGFRITQAFCFGIFALGLSMMAGDYSSFIKSPISSFSITTTIFGGIGALITGYMANKCREW